MVRIIYPTKNVKLSLVKNKLTILLKLWLTILNLRVVMADGGGHLLVLLVVPLLPVAVKLVLMMVMVTILMWVTIGGVASVRGVPGPGVSPPCLRVVISTIVTLMGLVTNGIMMVTIHIMVSGVTVLFPVPSVLHALQKGVTWSPVISVAPAIMHWPATQQVIKSSGGLI